MTRESFDVEKMDANISVECIQSALKNFKEGKAVNCVQTAHLAKAANAYINQKPFRWMAMFDDGSGKVFGTKIGAEIYSMEAWAKCEVFPIFAPQHSNSQMRRFCAGYLLLKSISIRKAKKHKMELIL